MTSTVFLCIGYSFSLAELVLIYSFFILFVPLLFLRKANKTCDRVMMLLTINVTCSVFVGNLMTIIEHSIGEKNKVYAMSLSPPDFCFTLRGPKGPFELEVLRKPQKVKPRLQQASKRRQKTYFSTFQVSFFI